MLGKTKEEHEEIKNKILEIRDEWETHVDTLRTAKIFGIAESLNLSYSDVEEVWHAS